MTVVQSPAKTIGGVWKKIAKRPPMQPTIFTLLKAMLVKPDEKTCSCKLHLAEHCVSADFKLAHDLVLPTLLRRLGRLGRVTIN